MRKIFITVIICLIPSIIFSAQNNAIRVDMEGYRTASKKSVMLVGQNYTSFTVKKVSDNSTVYTGTFGGTIADAASGDSVRQGDFSSVTAAGDYYVQVTGLGESYSFTISDTVFNNVFITAMRGLYGQRCGPAISFTHRGTTFSHGACHTGNSAYDATTGLSGSRNCTGGWHDAGDYGKYALNGGVTMGTLLLMYERYKDILEAVNLGLPYSGGALPDVLVEIKYNLDFMMKMQYTTAGAMFGGVFHKVSNGFPAMTLMPQNDGATDVFQISSCATGDFAAVMAIASRVFEPYDAAYALSCSISAKNAWTYLKNNANIVPAGGFTGGLGGAYGDTDDRDERLWAAVELFNSTGATDYNTYVYDHYLDRALTDVADGGDDWKELHPVAYMSYIQSPQAAVNATVVAAMKTAFQAHVNTFRSRSQSTDGYKYVLVDGNYFWGSNSIGLNRGMRMLAAADIFNDSTYKDAAEEIVHYMLGRNPFNKSFVTYVGDSYMSNPHHRPSIGDSITPPWPGLLIGGANNEYNGGDPVIPAGQPAAKTYIDNDGSWGTNEIAINWQSSLIYVLAAFCQPPPPTPTPTATITGTPPTATITPTFTATPTFMEIRVNCGGPLFTDTPGKTWSADKAYTGYTGSAWGYVTAGQIDIRTGDITNTGDDTLFLYDRWSNNVSNLDYAFDVGTGTYQVRLRFAETWFTAAGQRKFNISLEGTLQQADFDIIGEAAGAWKYVDKTFVITVTDGTLNVSLTKGSVDWPVISAIEVITYYPPNTPTYSASPTKTVSPTITKTKTVTATPTASITGTPPTATSTVTFTATAVPTALRIDCGGPGYFDGTNTWIADAYFSGGNTGSTTDAIGLTTADVLYQTERYGTFSYDIPVADGTYEVTLKFCEFYFSAPLDRYFDVSIEGSAVLDNLDVLNMAGFENAYDRVFTVTVSDGVLNIQFTGVKDNATIDAIQVRPVIPTPTNTPSRTVTFTRTPVLSPTFTATYTGTRTLTATSTATDQNTPTYTGTITATATATSTGSETPKATESSTITVYSPTFTLTATRTKTSTATYTATVSQTYTATATPTFTSTKTATSTATMTPTVTQTNTPAYSATATPTITFTITGTPPSETFTPSITRTWTYSQTPTGTQTFTMTSTHTPTLTFTNSPVNTMTYTVTRTNTPGNTPTFTYSHTPLNTETQTSTLPPTQTRTPVNTATYTWTMQAATPTFTPTSTAIAQTGGVTLYPNPVNPATQDLYAGYTLERNAEKVEFFIYSSGFRQVARVQWNNPGAGYNKGVVERQYLQGLSNGTYYYMMQDDNGKRLKTGNFIILK